MREGNAIFIFKLLSFFNIFIFLTSAGTWAANEMMQCLDDLFSIGLRVRGIVTDNHSANVAAFNLLLSSMPGNQKNFFVHPNATTKTYVLFDSVHLIKNVRNNLINARKFVFPAMDFKVFDIQIRSEPGYMSWGDLHKLYDHEQKLDANLRKAHKLSYQAVHPGNNK